mgnify:CR=1 FL=1
MNGTEDTNTNLGSFEVVINSALKAMQLAGAELVEDQEFERREKICQGCNDFVNLGWKGFEVKGCGICKCPLVTKGRTSKYFSFSKMKVIDTKCPSMDGDKWSKP